MKTYASIAMRLLPAILTTLCLASPLAILPASTASAQVSEGAAVHSNARTSADGTIRATVHNLMRGMIAYERGKQDEADEIVALFEAPPDIPQEKRYRFLLNAAKRLNLVLQNIDFGPGSLPLDPEGDSYRLVLGEGRQQVALDLVRLPGGQWAFSYETASSPKIKELYKYYRERFDKLTRADTEGGAFAPNLMSPFRTVLTLLSGVNGENGYTLEDAASTLDLTGLSPLARDELGKIWAVMLYRVIAYGSSLRVEDLSADPQSQRTPILLVIPGTGVITLHVVEDPETKIKSWRFPYQCVEAVMAEYDSYMARGMAEEIRRAPKLRGKNLPMHVILDDYIQTHLPRLEGDLLSNDIWKWFSLILLMAVSPLIWWITGVLFRVVGNWLHLFDEQGLNRSRRLVVIPAQVLVLGLFWSQTLVFVTLYPWLIDFLTLVLRILTYISLAWLAGLAIDLLAHKMSCLARTKVRQTMILVIGQVFKAGVILVALANLATLFGQDSTRILTALGIGGVALALAFKQTLENVFGTFMILSTRPFAMGDWIVVANVEGIVESVGMRSTMVRTLYDSLVTVPNATFISQPVDNYGKRACRRYKTTIRLPYETPPDLVDAYVQGLRELFMAMPLARKDDFHIRLHDFGESALEVLVYVFFVTDDWGVEFRERENFIRQAIRLAGDLGVDFGPPAQIVKLETTDPGDEHS
jgi:MscS family membrane protein